MAEDLENDKWVEIHIGLMSPSTEIIKIKKDLNDYANELGWEINIDKKGVVDEEGNRVFNIRISPKGDKISPEELREKSDIINGFSVSVLRDVIYVGRENELSEISRTWLAYRNEEKKCILDVRLADVLIINCELKKAIKLELESPNLFKKAFGISLKKWYDEHFDKKDKIFISSENREGAEAIVRILEENGMPKATTKKKNILKRLF